MDSRERLEYPFIVTRDGVLLDWDGDESRRRSRMLAGGRTTVPAVVLDIDYDDLTAERLEFLAEGLASLWARHRFMERLADA